MSKEVKFTNAERDIFGEQRMEKFGLKFEVQILRDDQINFKLGLENMARISKPLDLEWRDRYAQAICAGEVLPMPIVRYDKTVDPPYVPVGGNHRLAAGILAKKVDFKCYVVRIDDKMVADLLPRTLNTGHGLATSKSELVMHAAHAVEAFGLKVKEASSMFGIAESAIRSYIRAEHARSRLTKLNVRTGPLSRAALCALEGISNEPAMSASANFLLKANGLLEHDQLEFVNQVKEAPTEASSIAVVAEWEKKLGVSREDPRKEPLRPIRRRYSVGLAMLEGVLKGKTKYSQLQITTNEDVEQFKKRGSEISRRIRSLA